MANIKKIGILASVFVIVNSFPQEPLVYKNTIFGDETVKEGPFARTSFFDDNSISKKDISSYRLPQTTRPVHYNLLWSINITDLSFSGEVEIYLFATKPNVDEIVIHSHDLNIRSIHLIQGNTSVYQTYTLQPEYHFLRVKLLSGSLIYEPLPVLYKLVIDFEAPLRTDMYGIYRSWFKNNASDSESWMATSLFAPSAARFAFPCYDEPSLKATFDVTIRRPAGFGSWFCTRERETRNSSISGYEEVEYFTTPLMSTYLLAIVVAEYKNQEVKDNGTLVYEVIARPAAIENGQGDYAFEVGQIILTEMSNYTDFDFYSASPEIKMTQAAIPDFSAGAMENWGLLAYREAYLMYDKNHTNGHFKQIIAYIVAHETSHMWFGNLVTCDWWDALWLNEGFARYFQYILANAVEDQMGFLTRFVNEQVHASMLTDSADNPHPLTNPSVGSPASVDAMFSTITYNKGASIIRMTEHLMGAEALKEGLQLYLKIRSFSTALPIHLFLALQEIADERGLFSNLEDNFNIADYYRTWTEQGGHPVLNVDVNHQTGFMTVHQRRFNINSGYSVASTNWIVPVTFATASNPDFSDTKPSHIIKDAVTVINRTTIGDEWVIFNKQQTGYYRVNYDDYTWNLITMVLRSPNRTVIHEHNRAQIVDDVFQFARSGLMSYNKAFNILSFLVNETEYNPWVAAITGFNWIKNRFVATSIESELDHLFINWASLVMGDLTYYPEAGESFMRSYLRYQLAPVMCRLEVPECREAAYTQLRNLIVNGTEVHVDSRNWVYCNGLRDGTVDDFEYLWKRYLEHPVYTEKILMLQNLGCTPHAMALNKFLDGIVQDNFEIRPQDYTVAFNSAVTGNEANTEIVFEYIKNNLKTVINAFNSASTPLSYISSRLRTEQKVNEFREWANNNQDILGTSYQEVYNGAATAVDAMKWAAEVQNDIKSYLDNGDDILWTSTAAPELNTSPEIVSRPPILEPITPRIPDSANQAFLSQALFVTIVVLNLMFKNLFK